MRNKIVTLLSATLLLSPIKVEPISLQAETTEIVYEGFKEDMRKTKMAYEERLENERLIQEHKSREMKARETQKISQNRMYVTFEVSFYCPCYLCTQNGNRKTASGEYAREGVTIAMPKDIPFGSQVYIEGLGTYVAQDRGGYIKNTYDVNGNKIVRVDIFLESHEECYRRGRYTASGYIDLKE